MNKESDRFMWLRRFVFGGYAGTIFALTHWPRLSIDTSIQRPDLIAHVTIFGLWVVVALGAKLFGPALSNRNMGRTGALAVAYASLDEWTQSIPFLGRTAALDDWFANVLGILVGLGACTLFRVWLVGRA